MDVLSSVSGYAQPFSAITGSGVILISPIFTWAVGFRPTGYPRWMASLSPLVLVVLVIVLGRLLPGVGDVILPATFSIANAIFFALSAVRLLFQLARNLVSRSSRTNISPRP